MSDNPYSTPNQDFETPGNREAALARVKTPATLLLVTGILGIIGALLTGAMPSALPSFMQSMLDQASQDPNFGQEQQAALEAQIAQIESMSIVYYAQAVIGVIGSIVMCLGAMKMKKLEGFGFSMTACILAICPFTSPCCSCIFPIAIGIWGIVVISNQEVKPHFR